MKIRFPLYAKFLVWFFLNLVCLAAVTFAFFEMQAHIGLDSLLLGRSGARFQSLTEIITTELNESGRPIWDDVLKRFSAAYHLQIYLFNDNGIQIAGSRITLPTELKNSIAIHRRPPPFRLADPDGLGPPPFSDDPPPEEGPPPKSLSGPPTSNAARPRFLYRTSHPTQYWAGIRIHLNGFPQPPGPPPTVLIAMSDSLNGDGVFFDIMPWIAVSSGAILFSVLFWLPLARGLTRSISQMTHATQEIASGRFTVQVNTRRRDELGQLGDAVNQMGSRLAGFVSGQKRFLGDIAHELCSPLARIQLSLGILEHSADEKMKAQLADLDEDIQQMSSLVNELLSFSKASLEPASIQLEPVLLAPLIEQAIRRESNEDIRIVCHLEQDLAALGHSNLLLRAISNLLRNAIRYAGQAGPIKIVTRLEGKEVLLVVSDNGPGVPAEALPQLFDPFYRPEPSRDRQTGGVGLGLAIVKTCVESCQATVSARNCEPSGFEVEIRLQAASLRED